ncbi:MAG: 50S ribosomal protein L17 [Planctomycetales bacterium]|nr:50S ribosomal protein L17 [Planctomycetales bacterium]
MRHRRHGRVLGRSPSHRKALLRNLVCALVLTERVDTEFLSNPAKVKGRIITTLPKAKEVRPLVEKCVTIAIKGRIAERAAAEFATEAERNTEQWKQWRNSEAHAKWVAAVSPAVNARRKLYNILQDKEAVSILFNEIADRFEGRPGGYTRIMRLATPRLGDAGVRAILEFVGKHDRVVARSQKPSFADDAVETSQGEDAVNEKVTEDVVAQDSNAAPEEVQGEEKKNQE